MDDEGANILHLSQST